MKIVIIGGDRVGTAIASQLTVEGHDITVIDSSSQVVDRISDSLDCMAIHGGGAEKSVMMQAGVDKADLIIACTGEDELNLLCCVFAKKLGCGGAIARVRTPEYVEQVYELKDDFGLSMIINPELNAAEEMFRLLEIPGVLRRDTFAKGKVEIVEVLVDPGDVLDGFPLSDWGKKIRCRALVCVVRRGEETIIPDGRFVFKPGDKVYICAPATEIVRMLRATGEYRRKARDIMLIGGSRPVEYLVPMLLKSGAHVKIIEPDRANAEHFAEHFPEISVICADGSSEMVLREEHAEEMDAVATLTNRDEENLILSMYIASLGVPQVLTMVDHIGFSELFSRPENRIISPKQLCASAIISYVRARQNSGGSAVVTLHHIADGHAEALEFEVTSAFLGAGHTLRNLKRKQDILIACINRGGKVIIPGGNDTIEAGDTVIVVARSGRKLLDLNDIMEDE
ncbi:MAG: Trk system potassium transporter TrkA [Clostridiales bacterium]|nr:Trk system potassium transporter TrkA [Clostridiales bacterium]